MPIALTRWIPEIYSTVIGVPNPTLKKAVLWAVRDFCKETHLYKYTPDPIDIVADQQQYTFTLPTDTEVIKMDRCKVDGKAVTIWSSWQEDIEDSDWESETAATPNRAHFDLLGNVNLVGIPEVDITAGLKCRFIIMPTKAATEVDDRFEEFFEGLGYGAIYNLKNIGGQPWSNAVEAAHYYNLYRKVRDGAKMYTHFNRNVRPRMRVKPEPFV